MSKNGFSASDLVACFSKRRIGTMLIRLALVRELAALPALELSAGQLFVTQGFGDEVHASPAEAWRPSLEAGLLWVVDIGSPTPVAFLAARRYENSLYIAEVDVAFEHQRQGFGRALVEHAIQKARDQGLASVGLTTAMTPPWNASAYLRMGFRISESPPPWLAELLGAEVQNGQKDRCAMVLDLTSNGS